MDGSFTVALLNASLSHDDGDDALLNDGEVLRLNRIDKYQQQSLDADDPLDAGVGALTGEILTFAQHYEQAMFKLLDENCGTIHVEPKQQRATGTYLNLTRQAERNVNLLIRLAEDRRHSARIKSPSHQLTVPGTTTQRNRRK